MTAKNGLSTKKQRAIAGLLTERTQAAAADTAGVSGRTIARWLAEDTEFQAALGTAENEAVSAAARTIANAAAGAVDVLRQIIDDPTAPNDERRKAATAILRTMPSVRLLGRLERSIIELEDVR